MTFSLSSALMLRLFASSCSLCFLMYSHTFLVTSVRGSGAAPITAARAGLGVRAFMNAALGVRFAATFFAAAFFAGVAFLAVGAAVFLAGAFFAVAMCIDSVEVRSERGAGRMMLEHSILGEFCVHDSNAIYL